MGYFYARAKERAAEPFGGLVDAEGAQAADAVDQRPFRHAGPKPQSREAALIMLADSVEASVRSLASRDEPAIRAMVTRIIEERIADGQFDECDLTLRDLERIREAFVAQLLGMYHTRIAYPQNKVVELESRARQRRRGRRRLERIGAGRIYLAPWRSRPRRPRRGRRSRRGARGWRGRSPRRWTRGRGARAGLDRADPDRRRRAGRAERDAHGQDRPDRRAVVPAAAARGVPGASGRRRTGGAAAARPPRSRCRRAARPPRRHRRLGGAGRRAGRGGRGGQTGDVRWSPADELRLLVTHGTLHVCGWDHAEPAEEAAMRALERRLLASAGPGRPGRGRTRGTIRRGPPARPRPDGIGPCRAVRGGSVEGRRRVSGTPDRSTRGRATTSAGWSWTGSPSGPAGPARAASATPRTWSAALPRARPDPRQAADVHERLGSGRPQGPRRASTPRSTTSSSSPTTSPCPSASCASAKAAARAATTACARSSTSSAPRSSAGSASGSASRTGTPSTMSCRKFAPDEQQRLDELLDAAADAVEAWAREGTSKAANRFNKFELRPGRHGPARRSRARSTGRPARTASAARRPAGARSAHPRGRPGG